MFSSKMQCNIFCSNFNLTPKDFFARNTAGVFALISFQDRSASFFKKNQPNGAEEFG